MRIVGNIKENMFNKVLLEISSVAILTVAINTPHMYLYSFLLNSIYIKNVIEQFCILKCEKVILKVILKSQSFSETRERAVRSHDELFGAYATGKRHRE